MSFLGLKIRVTAYISLSDQILDAGSLILDYKTDVIHILSSIQQPESSIFPKMAKMSVLTLLIFSGLPD